MLGDVHVESGASRATGMNGAVRGRVGGSHLVTLGQSLLPLQAGMTYQGSQLRLRAALDRYLHKGADLTVTFLGGSITAGHGQNEGLNYPM